MYNIIFLGDRRVAANAIRLISSSQFSDKFKIRAIVSSEEFIENAKQYLGVDPDVKISNQARNARLIADAISELNINLLISVQHNWILSTDILSKVELAFNLHNAKLPDYKGYNSISHAIHNRDTNFYSTIHWMAEEVDTGDIAYEYSTPIEQNDDAYSLYLKTVDSSEKIFEKFLSDLASDTIPPKHPINGDGVFYKKDELASLKDISNISDEVEFDFRVRSVFFPPHEPAYVIKNNNKLHLIPERWKSLSWANIEAGYIAQWKKNQ